MSVVTYNTPTEPKNGFNIPTTTRDVAIIPLWLRDTYALVHNEPLNRLQGPLNENASTEEIAQSALLEGSDTPLFLSGGDIYTHIGRNSNKFCNQTVTIVIRGLRDLYWNVRQTLPDIAQLEIAARQPLPVFKNIFEYTSLENMRDFYPSPLYQMFGTLTPYNVIHVPVRHFVETLNARLPLKIILADTEVMIQLDHEPYDFWDPESESLIDHVDC